jgi:hypothetical protein
MSAAPQRSVQIHNHAGRKTQTLEELRPAARAIELGQAKATSFGLLLAVLHLQTDPVSPRRPAARVNSCVAGPRVIVSFFLLALLVASFNLASSSLRLGTEMAERERGGS